MFIARHDAGSFKGRSPWLILRCIHSNYTSRTNEHSFSKNAYIYASAANSRRRASCIRVIRPAIRPVFVSSPISCNAISPYIVEGFQWNLA